MPRIHAADRNETGSRLDSYYARSAIFAAALARNIAATTGERAGERSASGSAIGLTSGSGSPKHVEVTRTPLRRKGWAVPGNPRRLVNYQDLDNNCWVGMWSNCCIPWLVSVCVFGVYSAGVIYVWCPFSRCCYVLGVYSASVIRA